MADDVVGESVDENRREFVRRRKEKEEEIASCLIDIKATRNRVAHSFFLKAEITGHIRCHCGVRRSSTCSEIRSNFSWTNTRRRSAMSPETSKSSRSLIDGTRG